MVVDAPTKGNKMEIFQLSIISLILYPFAKTAIAIAWNAKIN